jgi:hypothetical protein
MATVNWPTSLRNAIQQGKSRSIGSAFRQADPAAGPPFVERFTDDEPVFYDFQLRFNRIEALVFFSWFRDPLNADKGLAEFNFPFEAEWGDVEEDARFTSDGVPQLVSQVGGISTYSARVVIREFTTQPDPEFVLGYWEEFENDLSQLNFLDIMINESMPV